MVHVIIPVFVGQLQLIIKNLRVVDTESSLLAPHPDYLIDQVELILGELWIFVLLHDQLRFGLIFRVIEIQNGPLATWLLDEVLLDDPLGFHHPKDILFKDVVTLIKLSFCHF